MEGHRSRGISVRTVSVGDVRELCPSMLVLHCATNTSSRIPSFGGRQHFTAQLVFCLVLLRPRRSITNFVKELLSEKDDTPYPGDTFNASLPFPPNYPFTPPKLIMITRVYHSNFDENGAVAWIY